MNDMITTEGPEELAARMERHDWVPIVKAGAAMIRSLHAQLANAKAAQAMVVERAAENKEQLDIWAQEILEGLAFADVLKITSYEDKIEAHDMVGRGLVEVIRALADADGLAAVEALRAERDEAVSTLAYCEKQWTDTDRVTHAKMLDERVRADRLSAELAQARADTQAAVALVVEQAESECRLVADRFRSQMAGTTLADASYRLAEAEAADKCATAIRALAPVDGLAEVAKLRAERDEALAEVAHVHEDRAYIIGANAGWDAAVEQGEASPAVSKAMVRFWKKMAETHSQRADRIAAANAALQEQVKGLTAYGDPAFYVNASQMSERATERAKAETEEWKSKCQEVTSTKLRDDAELRQLRAAFAAVQAKEVLAISAPSSSVDHIAALAAQTKEGGK